MMTNNEILTQWIPYRLEAIDTLQFAWKWAGESKLQSKVDVLADGKLKLQGNVAAIANPMIEAGIIHARALLEFLGLGTQGGRLVQVNNKRRADDVAIEHFSTPTCPISKITVIDALSAYTGPKEEAEQALVAIFELANKWLAHLTTGVLSHDYTDQHLDIACRGIRVLLNNYLYAKLGREIPMPPSGIDN